MSAIICRCYEADEGRPNCSLTLPSSGLCDRSQAAGWTGPCALRLRLLRTSLHAGSNEFFGTMSPTTRFHPCTASSKVPRTVIGVDFSRRHRISLAEPYQRFAYHLHHCAYEPTGVRSLAVWQQQRRGGWRKPSLRSRRGSGRCGRSQCLVTKQIPPAVLSCSHSWSASFCDPKGPTWTV
jgi:hypothetical protein